MKRLAIITAIIFTAGKVQALDISSQMYMDTYGNMEIREAVATLTDPKFLFGQIRVSREVTKAQLLEYATDRNFGHFF